MQDLEGSVWQVLRRTYIRLLCIPEGRDPQSLSLADENLLLDPHIRSLERDFKMLMEIIGRSYGAGISSVYTLLHGAEGVDHEMLDQAIEYAKKEADEVI